MLQRHKAVRPVLQKGPQLLGEEGSRRPQMVCGWAQKQMRSDQGSDHEAEAEGPVSV